MPTPTPAPKKALVMIDGDVKAATVLTENADGTADLVIHNSEGEIVRGVPGARFASSAVEKSTDGFYWLQ